MRGWKISGVNRSLWGELKFVKTRRFVGGGDKEAVMIEGCLE